MTDVAIDLARWWPLLLLPAAIWLSLWTLRGTRPAPSRPLARGLLILRLALWTALILLLCGPRLRWNHVERRPAVLAVLLDNSASLQHLEGRLDHQDWLPALGKVLEDAELRVFAYDGGLRELPRDAPFVLPGDGVETDLDAALAGVERAMQGEHWTGLLVVGDGNPTRGAWPLERSRGLPARIWTAGTGRLDPAVDLLLRTVEVNRQARLGQVQPLMVELESRGLAGRSAVVVLREQGIERARMPVILSGDGARQPLELGWTPQTAGPRLLQVEALLAGGGERTTANNSRALQVHVDEALLPVLILAGRPSEDLAFLRSVLEARKDMELYFSLPERPGADQAGIRRAIDRARMLVLVDWPPRGRSSPLAQTVASRAERTPLFWLEGGGSALEVLNPTLAQMLGPWQPGPPVAARAARAHSLLGREEGLVDLQAVYAQMPPVTATRRAPAGGLDAAALILLESVQGHPLLLVQERAGLRRVWMPVSGLWRWGVGSQLSMGQNERARTLVGSLLNWLEATPGQGLLEVRPDREALPAGAPLTFNARLQEEDGRPRDGASIELELQGDSLGRVLRLEPRGGGTYAGALLTLPVGEWVWHAFARQGDRPIVSDSGRVLVEARSPESLDATRNQRLLGELASLGGGRALDLDSPTDRARLASGEALDSLETRPLLRRAGHQWELAGEGWILAALILLIAGEWIWRRLNGLL